MFGHCCIYRGALKSHNYEARTAVVRTLEGCDVECSMERCDGTGRLLDGMLVKIEYHKSGADRGRTFLMATSGECTPVQSREPSRAPSRDPNGLGRA